VTYNLDMDKLGSFTGEDAKFKNGIPADVKAGRDAKAAEVQTGFLAQEVEASAQKLGYDFSGVQTPEDANDHYTLRYAEFVVPLVKATQEQQATIEAQNIRIAQLETQITSSEQLRIEVEELKRQIALLLQTKTSE